MMHQIFKILGWLTLLAIPTIPVFLFVFVMNIHWGYGENSFPAKYGFSPMWFLFVGTALAALLGTFLMYKVLPWDSGRLAYAALYGLLVTMVPMVLLGWYASTIGT